MNGQGTIHRVCYIAKINEKVMKGDFEKQLNEWGMNVFETCETTEEGEELGEYTGF